MKLQEMNRDMLLGYVAGLLDGDGSISCKTYGPPYPWVEIELTGIKGKRLLKAVQELFGGSLTEQVEGAHGLNTQATCKWYITGKAVEVFLKPLVDILQIKNQQAEIDIKIAQVLKLHGGGNGNKLTERELLLRLKLAELLQHLNSRGTNSPSQPASPTQPQEAEEPPVRSQNPTP